MKNTVIDLKARLIRYDVSINLILVYMFLDRTKLEFPFNVLGALSVLAIIEFHSGFVAGWSSKDA